ncbi:MAG TPA: hypothetical protein VNO14_13220 [Blastocatellia bacterium]|nr:hypothetical protein [Blastocatellia bacterium]
MRSRLPVVLALIFLNAGAALAQKHEISFTAGALKTGDHNFIFPTSGRLRTGTGFTYQLSYAQRFFDGRLAALYFEFPFTATPDTDIDTSNALSPRSYSSLFITPGIKLKLLPGLKYSPYLAAGVGYARFDESDTRVDNQPNTGDRGTNRAAYTIGGGLDVKVFPFLSLRGEVRDFYSGTPRFNADILDDRQHNFLVSTGLVLRF